MKSCFSEGRTSIAWVAVLAATSWQCACDSDGASTGGALLPPMVVSGLGPVPITSSTTLHVSGSGFLPAAVVTHELTLEGRVDGVAAGALVYPAQRLDDATLAVAMDGRLMGALGTAQGGRFDGTVQVSRRFDDGRVEQGAKRPVGFELTRHLAPELDAVDLPELYPGDEIAVSGDGFLAGSEGTTLVRFDGRFDVQQPPSQRSISSLVVPLQLLAPTSRSEGRITLTPDIFGIRPGTYDGEIRVVNVHADGTELVSASAPLRVPLRSPVIGQVTPRAVSRGQRLFFSGRGLQPPDGLLQAATVVLLDGVFTPRRGVVSSLVGTDAIVIYPDEHRSNVELSAPLRVVLDADGHPSGLGSTAGIFEGLVTPLLLAGPDSVEGPGLPVTLTINNPKQVVWVRFLPAFSDALTEFGLLAEREAVRQRIMEVVTRDYAGVNIEFTQYEPLDFVEYSVVEVSGEDPNGSDLFGLDNTLGKDVGNLRFDDVIGGFNAETRAQNFAAFGGIFVSELLHLSPQLSDRDIASPRFDDIFGEVTPILGGNPARAGESEVFDERGAAITKAVRVLGNLVGNTITHEVGHSLGLTALEGRVHNVGDNPGWIMDTGSHRPFEERAEIDGQGPAVFSPFNQEYLRSILPLDPDPS